MNPARWDEFTALFGGTFDPPHMGHREAVRGLFRDPGVARVVILPAGAPPHKTFFASNEDRAEMARICFSASPGDPFPAEVRVDSREIKRLENRPGSSTYTFDTIQELRQEHQRLAFVIGTDQLEKLHTWYRFPELLGLIHWIVLERRPEGDRVARQVLSQWESGGLVRPDSRDGRAWRIPNGNTVLRLSVTDAPALSSTDIREALARSGDAPAGSLAPGVLAYLKQKHLYGSTNAP